jgi:DNA polymerase-3 subunit gamma/tau
VSINDFFERHRPRTLDEVAGNHRAKHVLRRILTRFGVPRGILFYGPRGCGKSTLARLLVRAQLCEARPLSSADACGACYSCRQRFHSSLGFEVGLVVRDGVRLTPDHLTEDLQLTQSYRTLSVVYDEFQESSKEVQARLRTQLETGALTNLVLCAASLAEIDPAVRQRLVRIEVAPPARDEMILRLRDIAAAEGVEVESAVLEGICDDQRSVPRRCMNDLFHLMLYTDAITTAELERIRTAREVSPTPK